MMIQPMLCGKIYNLFEITQSVSLILFPQPHLELAEALLV